MSTRDGIVRLSVVLLVTAAVLTACGEEPTSPSNVPASSTNAPATSLSTTTLAAPSLTVTTPLPPEDLAADLPVVVSQPWGGTFPGTRTLMIWADGRYSEYQGWGVDLTDNEQILALSTVVPTHAGEFDEATAAAVVDVLAGDLSGLRTVEDDIGCTAVDGVALGYAFPTAQPSISFLRCTPPVHPLVKAADVAIAAAREDIPDDPKLWQTQSPELLANVIRERLGFLIEGAVSIIDDSPTIGFDVTRVISGPSNAAPVDSFEVGFDGRQPTELETQALADVQIGDRIWAVVDASGVVESAGVFDQAGELIDTGPATGGLSLGNQAAILSALDADADPGLVCRLDPEYRQPLAEDARRAEVLEAVLHEWSVTEQRRRWYGPNPGWARFVDMALTEPTTGRWIALSVGDTIFGLGDLLELGQIAAGDTIQISYDYFPSDGPLLVWEIDRAALEAASCEPRDVTWLPSVLEDHGTLLVTVAREEIGAAGLRIDLGTLTYETGWED